MPNRKIHFADNLEREIADILDNNNIHYVHESENNGSRLDFYLPEYKIYIEVKQFHTDRVIEQLSSKDNVILIQGKNSIEFLKTILKPKF